MGLAGGLATNGQVGGAVSSPVNLVTTAANPVLANKLASGDANPTFQLNGDGSLHFGAGGASALDTVISRSSANTVMFSGGIQVSGNAPVIFSPSGSDIQVNSAHIRVGYDLHARNGGGVYQVDVGGVGPGSAAGIWMANSEAGSNLYREAAGKLRCDGVLHSDLQTLVASVTTARAGGAAAAPPAAPVKYLALQDETGARVYVAAYS